MHKIYSKALDLSIDTGRIIGRVDGEHEGPTLLFFGGVHGNEPSGVFALKQVIGELEQMQSELHGSVIAIAGNLKALHEGKRFSQEDLNRLWRGKNITELEKGSFRPINQDEEEQLEIFQLIEKILGEEDGPFYFFDLHTTSSRTPPFITVNDSILNREFTKQYPVPLILGIEEYLDGPLLSYVNELGYVSFGFEAGQHDAVASIENEIAFAFLSLHFAGALSYENAQCDRHNATLRRQTRDLAPFYEIYERYAIAEDEQFAMEKGFQNFQHVQKGELLAISDGEELRCQANTTIFMPLYQAQGSDGYFLIRRVHPFFLWASRHLRKWKADHLLLLLPGIQKAPGQEDTLEVDLRVARFLAKPLLHLLGYRGKHKSKHHLWIKSREWRSKREAYAGTPWFK